MQDLVPITYPNTSSNQANHFHTQTKLSVLHQSSSPHVTYPKFQFRYYLYSSEFCRETEPTECTYIDTRLKKLAHVKIQNVQSRPAGWRPGEELQFESKGGLLVEFFPSGSEEVSLCSLRTFNLTG